MAGSKPQQSDKHGDAAKSVRFRSIVESVLGEGRWDKIERTLMMALEAGNQEQLQLSEKYGGAPKNCLREIAMFGFFCRSIDCLHFKAAITELKYPNVESEIFQGFEYKNVVGVFLYEPVDANSSESMQGLETFCKKVSDHNGISQVFCKNLDSN